MFLEVLLPHLPSRKQETKRKNIGTDMMMEEWWIWWHQWLLSAGLCSWQALFPTTLMLLEDSCRETSAKTPPGFKGAGRAALIHHGVVRRPCCRDFSSFRGVSWQQWTDLNVTPSAMLIAGAACTELQEVGSGRAGWDGCRGCSAHTLRGGICSKFEALGHHWPCVCTIKSFQVTSLSLAKPY